MDIRLGLSRKPECWRAHDIVLQKGRRRIYSATASAKTGKATHRADKRRALSNSLEEADDTEVRHVLG